METEGKRSRSPNDKYYNQSILKAISLLELFTVEKYELSLSVLAKELKMPVSTTHRLINTLESVGYISQNPENGKYRLGISCFVLGSRVQFIREFSEIAKPFLNELSQRYNESVSLSISNGTDDILCIAKVDAKSSFYTTPTVGGTRKIHISSCGKCILAYQSKAEQNNIISQIHFERYTPNTIMTELQLRQELEEVKRNGYATEHEEGEMGIFCCGAPIFIDDENTCVGAVSLSMPISRLSGPKDSLIENVKDTARQISDMLRHTQ